MFEVAFHLSLIPKLVGNLLRLISYFHSRFYRPFVEYLLETIFGISEEFSKLIVRESFNHIIRFLNGLFLWIVAFWERAKETNSPSVFPSWQNLSPSSLNSLIDDETQAQDSNDGTESSKDGGNDSVFVRWWRKLWRRDNKTQSTFMKQSQVVRELLKRDGGAFLKYFLIILFLSFLIFILCLKVLDFI